MSHLKSICLNFGTGGTAALSLNTLMQEIRCDKMFIFICEPFFCPLKHKQDAGHTIAVKRQTSSVWDVNLEMLPVAWPAWRQRSDCSGWRVPKRSPRPQAGRSNVNLWAPHVGAHDLHKHPVVVPLLREAEGREVEILSLLTKPAQGLTALLNIWIWERLLSHSANDV